MFLLYVIPEYRENSASERETNSVPLHFVLLGFPTLMNENSSGETLIGFDTTNTAVMEAGFSARQSDDLTSSLNEISYFKVL